jgi:hypothetical protein
VREKGGRWGKRSVLVHCGIVDCVVDVISGARGAKVDAVEGEVNKKFLTERALLHRTARSDGRSSACKCDSEGKRVSAPQAGRHGMHGR